MEVCLSSVDTAFLYGLTTLTDGLGVTFFPPLVQDVSQGVRHRVCETTNVSERSFCDSHFSQSSMKRSIV